MLKRLLRQAAQAKAGQRAPFAALDAFVEQPVLRALVRLADWRRARQRAGRAATPALRLAQAVDVLAPAERFAAALRAIDVSAPEAELARTRWAFAHGGYETADALALALTPRLSTWPRPARRKALALLSELAIARGAEAEARALWQRHDEAPTPALVARLDPDAPVTLATAFPALEKPDLYLADRLLRAGQLDPDQLARELLSQPLRWLQQPELELLLHQVKLRADPSDLSSLTRYLARHGLPGGSRAARGADFLHELRFAAPRAEPDGPLVSVLMAARNAAHTLPYAVDSVLNQSHRNLELVIADDASDDDSLALLRQRYGAEPRVRLLASRRAQGPYNLRNALLARARGEFVTFHDADDVSLPSRLARQLAALRASGQVACVSSWLRMRRDGSVVFFGQGGCARLSMVSLLATRTALATVGPYPAARFGADLDIVRRLAQRYGEPVRLREPLLFGLWSSQSLTRSQRSESLESGYRASARRRYSELVFRRELLGADALPAALLQRELERMDNAIEPAPIDTL